MSLTGREIVELCERRVVVLRLALNLFWSASFRFLGGVGVGVSKGPSYVV